MTVPAGMIAFILKKKKRKSSAAHTFDLVQESIVVCAVCIAERKGEGTQFSLPSSSHI